MPPDFAPVLRCIPTLDDYGRKNHAPPSFGDPVSELVIVRQKIDERVETADGFKLLAGGRHDRSEREVERLDAPGLQHLAPEIGVNRDGFPLHRQCCGIGQLIKTVH